MARRESHTYRALAQIPWEDQFEHETARELFGSNLLALTWIKGGSLPIGLVNDILRALGLERETETQGKLRRSSCLDSTHALMNLRSEAQRLQSGSSFGLSGTSSFFDDGDNDDGTDALQARAANSLPFPEAF